MKNYPKIILILLSLIMILFLIRMINPTQIDDVSPEIPCPEIEKYNPDIFYVIPYFDNNLISENKSFCEEMRKLNKTLALHGINHQPYQEFLIQNITQKQINFALEEFQKCFNQTPEEFKPPQLKISEENKELMLKNNFTIQTNLNQLIHKVYHCNDTGRFPNWLIKLF